MRGEGGGGFEVENLSVGHSETFRNHSKFIGQKRRKTRMSDEDKHDIIL
jgi:hypothetical protein